MTGEVEKLTRKDRIECAWGRLELDSDGSLYSFFVAGFSAGVQDEVTYQEGAEEEAKKGDSK